MPFWSLRRGTSSRAVEGTAAREVVPALEPVQIFLADRVVRGAVVPDGERLTDLIANQLGLRVQLEDGSWEGLSIDDIILVAPPPHASQRRIHRAKRRIELTADPYKITATAHLPPGTQLDPFVLRTGRPVLPVTGAWVRIEEDASSDQQLDVAIVTVKAISMARELLGVV